MIFTNQFKQFISFSYIFQVTVIHMLNFYSFASVISSKLFQKFLDIYF